jgi:hypothetical protein
VGANGNFTISVVNGAIANYTASDYPLGTGIWTNDGLYFSNGTNWYLITTTLYTTN